MRGLLHAGGDCLLVQWKAKCMLARKGPSTAQCCVDAPMCRGVSEHEPTDLCPASAATI